MERDVVIVFGFDESYYYNHKHTLECPNELYVAATRAKKLLILIHDESHQYLPFLMRSTNAIGNPHNLIRKRAEYEQRKATTSFIKHIKPNVLRAVMDMIEVHVIRQPSSVIRITNKVA
jgi:superfamily I DNA/RNA helicase